MSSNQTSLTPELFQQQLEVVKKNFDMFFLILMGNLVFCTFPINFKNIYYSFKNLICDFLFVYPVLKAAFAFFEMSFIRTKNVVSVLFRNYLDSGRYLRFTSFL